MENYKNVYREEAYELLSELETSLLALEKAPENKEIVSRVFRAMHTIKGSGAMFGFDDISSFTHDLETVYDLVRNDKLSVTKDLVGLTLAACDHIRAMLDSSVTNNPVDKNVGKRITESLKKMIPVVEKPIITQPKMTIPDMDMVPDPESNQPFATFRIFFRPAHDIFVTGTNPVMLLTQIKEMGQSIVIAHLDAIPKLKDIKPEDCYTYWDIILTTQKELNDIKDVFIFVEDMSELRIECIDESGTLTKNDFRGIVDLLLKYSTLSTVLLMDHIKKHQKRAKQKQLVQLSPVKQDEKTPEDSSLLKTSQEKVKTASIRVASEKLDTLVDLVGEFVTIQARLAQYAGSSKEIESVLISEQIEKLTAELRDNVMSLRMLAIGTMFEKFHRLVRDLCVDLGKDAELVTKGEETELDKTLIEKLNDPLLHLIRNAIDHGIEAPKTRIEKGKPQKGTIKLEAIHSGAHVLIKITDNGKGLDKKAIFDKAVQKGLVNADAELSEAEIFNFIFLPGFSTNEAVSNVSGRGVGMDVVRKAIAALGGSIKISSVPGTETTITLILPLTLAIIDGLLAKIGNEHFIFPLSAVDECIELSEEHILQESGRRTARVRGALVPYLRLRDYFNINGARPKLEQIVIANVNSQKFGFVVDRVIGGHQTVIKSLGKMYKDIEGVSGATILGDGSVALILDLIKLEQEAVNIERERLC